MIKCGIINSDYSWIIKDIKEVETEKYFTINMDNEYYILIDRSIYNEKNMSKILQLIAEVNKELLLNK